MSAVALSHDHDAQVSAESAPLPGCTALRWSPCCTWLAVSCAAEVAVIHVDGFSTAGIIAPASLSSSSSSMDCAWVPGSEQLAVWALTGSLGSFSRFAFAISPDWTPSELISLQGPVSDPQWGFQRLAATAADFGSLVLYALSPSSSSVQLIATLPAAMQVARSEGLWQGLTSYAWSPEVLSRLLSTRI